MESHSVYVYHVYDWLLCKPTKLNMFKHIWTASYRKQVCKVSRLIQRQNLGTDWRNYYCDTTIQIPIHVYIIILGVYHSLKKILLKIQAPISRIHSLPVFNNIQARYNYKIIYSSTSRSHTRAWANP